jgi:hypothetical protein
MHAWPRAALRGGRPDARARRSLPRAALHGGRPDRARAQIVELMGAEKGWWLWRRRAELAAAREYLATFKAHPGGVPGPIRVAKSPSAP